MHQHFTYQCLLLLCTSLAANAKQYCYHQLDCTDLHSWCTNGWCTCLSGYDERYYVYSNKLYCVSSVNVAPIVVPIVVVSAIIVAILVFYLCKRRRLARATQTTVWVQSPQAAMGVPVAAMYPTQPYQQLPPSYQEVPPSYQQAPPPYQQVPPPYSNYGSNNVNQSQNKPN